VGDILLRVLIGAFIGATVVGTSAVIHEILSESNIVEKIKKAFTKKRATKDTDENKTSNPFGAIVREKQKDSVNVDVFFNTTEETDVENVTVYANKVADDIEEGEWINLVD